MTTEINDKDDWSLLHTNIHAIRMLPKYQASDFEKKVGAMVLKRYSSTCSECKAVEEKLKNQPAQQQSQGFFSKINKIVEGL